VTTTFVPREDVFYAFTGVDLRKAYQAAGLLPRLEDLVLRWKLSEYTGNPVAIYDLIHADIKANNDISNYIYDLRSQTININAGPRLLRIADTGQVIAAYVQAIAGLEMTGVDQLETEKAWRTELAQKCLHANPIESMMARAIKNGTSFFCGQDGIRLRGF